MGVYIGGVLLLQPLDDLGLPQRRGLGELVGSVLAGAVFLAFVAVGIGLLWGYIVTARGRPLEWMWRQVKPSHFWAASAAYNAALLVVDAVVDAQEEVGNLSAFLPIWHLAVFAVSVWAWNATRRNDPVHSA